MAIEDPGTLWQSEVVKRLKSQLLDMCSVQTLWPDGKRGLWRGEI